MKDFKFEKGDYVVLLKACNGYNCWWDSMPINYCYRLRKESTNYMFYPELDIKGDDSNGWLIDSHVNNPLLVENKQMEVRYATSDEIAMYKKLQKPFNIDIIIKQQSENLDYLIDILKQHNVT